MYPINLYELTRLADYDKLAAYEQHLSKRTENMKIKAHEIDTISSLIYEAMNIHNNIDIFSGFFFSFNIPQIGQELDLIRISNEIENGSVVNIELKSRVVPDEEIKKQLMKNRYYLKFLKRNTELFSYTLENKRLLRLEKDSLIETSFKDLVHTLEKQRTLYLKNIDELFRVGDYLVSPLNTPERFLKNEYFLTKQQSDFKNEIIKKVDNSIGQLFIGITGSAGTGKTLLLYDIAKNIQKQICIIHCGQLSDGHRYLNNKMNNIRIVPAKILRNDFPLKEFDCIFVDECQRMHIEQFNKLINSIKTERKASVFSYDNLQKLQKKEDAANIVNILHEELDVIEYKLSHKIRTNKEIASFITKIMKIKSQDNIHDYSSVKILYAKNKSEANNIIRLHSDYKFIRFTPSQYQTDSLTGYGSELDYTTHEVIGQEYDRVIVVMDETFVYDEHGLLNAKIHPNPDYKYTKMLFQALTRCREKLAIVVVGNETLFNAIFGIVNTR